MSKLKLSNDRKVSTVVRRLPSGADKVEVPNAFGLPSGKAFSCPGATSVCERICYAGKLEKVYNGVRQAMLHNWELLKDAGLPTMRKLLSDMIDEFRAISAKKNAPLEFRIHWDGDFFSESYAMAWASVIKVNADIQFWVYTRSFTPALNVIPILADIPNLALYLSVDEDNRRWSGVVREEYPNVKLAVLAQTFEKGRGVMLELTNKPGGMCPENAKRIPLAANGKGACISCQLCPKAKADILFAIGKK